MPDQSQQSPTEPAEWVLCSGCQGIFYARRWARGGRVCPECGLHAVLDARARLESLADPGSIRMLDLPTGQVPDFLGFVDTRPYPHRLAEARSRTGLDAAVVCARLTIDGAPAVVAVMDFAFLGGSLGSVAGEAISLAAEAALADRVPLVAVTASGGARMQEGAISLMQMAKTSIAWGRLDEAGLLTISLITDPTYGGVAASFATLSDVIIGETGARLGFAGRRVIEQTIRQRLPREFQTVEFLLGRGFVDLVVPRSGLRSVLGRLLRVGPAERPVPTEGNDLEIRDWTRLAHLDAAEQVRLARDLTRPTALEYFALSFEEFQELHGDRLSGECPAMVTGLARLGQRWVAVIGQQKGHTPAELQSRNFGMPTPAGYRKAARIMRLAAKLGIPVVTLVDTPGAYPGQEAEEQGQAWAIAENLRLMAGLTVPVVSVITGEGGSGGALGIAVADRVLIWEHGVYSVISPEGCASILWKGSAGGTQAAAEALGLCSRDLLRHGIVDGVLPEPEGGVGADPVLAGARLRLVLQAHLEELSALKPTELVTRRRLRFSRYGRPAASLEGAAQ
jgi:acetyl-CoA carboxylase carboxyl transferase subunit beta